MRADVTFEIVREPGQAMLWHRLLVDEVLVPFVATSPRTPHRP